MRSIGSLSSRLNRAGQGWRPDVRVWGGRFSSSSFDRLLYLYLHKLRVMGSAERRLLTRRVTAGMTVLDIGANIGLYSVFLSRLVGDTGRVWSFEPEPTLFECLRRNRDRNGAANIVLHNTAVGAESGVATITRTLNSGDNRIRQGQAAGHGPSAPGETVRVVTLDEALGEVRPDFIKMDVQGFELRVLQGMRRTLRETPRLTIALEFWPFGLRAAGDDPAALLDLLRGESFTLYAEERGEEHPITDLSAFGQRFQGRTFGNVLAVRA